MSMRFRSLHLLALAFFLLFQSGCSVRKVGFNLVANALSEPGEVFSSDEDPELVEASTPFALKLMESIHAEVPKNRKLLLGLCRNFASYSVAFVATEAEALADTDYRRSQELEERALKLDLRGRDYCMQALEQAHPGIKDQLLKEPRKAVARVEGEKNAALLYWTGAAWGAAIGLGLDRPELVADLPAARALIERALELDPGYEQGVIHDAMITLEALPDAMGGSLERAREQFDQAIDASKGLRAGPYITWATAVCVRQQDRAEFERMLEKVLAIDVDAAPQHRLVNLIAQRRARLLQGRIDDLFLDGGEDLESNDNSP